jgi:phosphoglycolate phosphatase
MTFPFAIVGFDLDGTLLDTSGDLAAAVNFALAEAGRAPLTVEQVKPMIGGGAKHMLMQTLEATGGVSEDEAKRLYKLMLGFYEANLTVHTRPFPGAIAAVDELRSRGARVGVVTNKFESFAAQVLDQLGLTDKFDTLIGGDTLGRGNAKPSAAPIHELTRRLGGGRTAFVGDSIYDMQAARNAGVPSIAVSFGFLLHSLDEMGADAVIDGFDELIPALERLGG